MKAGDSDEFRLDGNAAAGILSEVFVPDLTTARATCAGCGAVRPVGALHVYAHEMGAVMRCPDCDGVIMRVARTRTHLWLDPTGVRLVLMSTESGRVADRARTLNGPTSCRIHVPLPLGQEGDVARGQVVHPTDDLDGFVFVQIGQNGAPAADAGKTSRTFVRATASTYAAFLLIDRAK